MKRTQPLNLFIAATVAALSLAGCTSSSTGTTTSGTTNSGTTASGGSASGGSASGSADASVQAKLDAAYKGITGTPPTTPTKPKAGVTAWVVSCGETVPSCSTAAHAAVEAAKKVGWTTNLCDGQLNPNGWGNCIRQAATAKANVVLPVGIDCASVTGPMTDAKNAGTKIVGAGGADCTATGGSSEMATERLQIKDTTVQQYWKNNGKLQADWLIGQTGGKAKVVELQFTDPVWGPWLTQGFEEELKTCSGCSVAKAVQISNNDMSGGAMATKFSSALLQATDANAVMIPVGGWMQAGLTSAIKSSGRASKLAVSAGFGDASTMDLIREKSFNFGALGYASEWGAYGSVDEAIRVMNGEKPVVEGDGFQMVDATHNLPATGDYTGGVDFKSQYLKLWGVA